MDDCLFCKILRGEVPCYKVYEDENFLAFLDVYPRIMGHTLVIPKKHYRWTYDVPNFGEYWEVVKKVSGAVQKTLAAEWVNYITHGEIPHAHIHIFPRNEKVEHAAIVPPGTKLTEEEFRSLAEKITKSF